ncbi:translation initiation factor 3 subunit H [Mytilus galloprovincialis]|uniref:Translation initiation factor 3 subunit H n=1 Tax=Mytilus galloprovincialis TaxID=29158 RepID=A0A8B6GC25_MYTGA|nr:translation initiation factor 3 subunit H [Mytilus galloprovincialis]
MASRKHTSSPVQYVQIDGLVVLKIVKHCQEEAAGGTDLVQGVLLGLVVDNKLEITNCFPFPRHNDEEEFNEEDNNTTRANDCNAIVSAKGT